MKRKNNQKLGERPNVMLSDIEKDIARQMMHGISSLVRRMMTPEERRKYRTEKKKVIKDREERNSNPVLCASCEIFETCQKRIHHGIDRCPYGIRK